MLVFGIDTCCNAATAAIIDDKRLVAQTVVNMGRTHSQIMMPQIEEMFKTTEIDVKKENPDKIFYEYIDNLKQTGVVLTDRLHGMIISYITNTPCI